MTKKIEATRHTQEIIGIINRFIEWRHRHQPPGSAPGPEL